MNEDHQPSERNRRLAANILAGRSPLDDQMIRTIRANAVVDLTPPPPRVLQLVDEVERLREELTKVKGYQAELSERCYRKDLELDELRVRDRVWRDGALAD